MTFTYTVDYDYIAGDVRVVGGNWNAASVTGGDITTGLKYVFNMILTHKGSSVEANVATVNETMPGHGDGLPGVMTIVCNTSDTGCWEAKGR